MTKEELIKEAWGEYYTIVKNQIDNNGWYKYFDLNNSEMKRKLWQFGNLELEELPGVYLIRPKSLKGIENNNGWIKIESEADLPKIGEYDMSSFTLYYWTNNGLYQSEDYKRWKLHYDHLQITHYRLEPIEKPKPPMY